MRFSEIADGIRKGLTIFAPLKELTRVFRHPPPDFAGKVSFKEHITQLNTCIMFLEENVRNSMFFILADFLVGFSRKSALPWSIQETAISSDGYI